MPASLNPLYYPSERETFWTVYTNFVMIFAVAVTNTYLLSMKGRCLWSKGFLCSQMIGLFGIFFDFLFYLSQLGKSSMVSGMTTIGNLMAPARFLFWEIFMSSTLLYTFFTAFRVLRRFQLYWEDLEDLGGQEEDSD